MKWNGKDLITGDLVTLSGKSEFGKSFVIENICPFGIINSFNDILIYNNLTAI